ncbi:MAG: uracil-DNA glycosylase [Pseudomonadota bacterium]|nr:uracil-DNA glycosylase [Pseudomonadota bacterium]
MGGDLDTIGPAEAKSALGWWLDAGVDAAVQEEPRDWLKPAPLPAPQSEARPEPANVRIPDPQSLEALKDWLATGADIPLAKGAGRRALPHGPEHAAVMLLCEAPGGSDNDRPIGGEPWQLAERMLAAIGFTPDQAYSASLSCVHVPGKKMNPAERELCAEIARRHIRLAQPKRLILLGDGPCQALLGKPLANARGHVHKIEGVRTVATFHPRHLIHRPLDKSLAWRDLLLLMEEEA